MVLVTFSPVIIVLSLQSEDSLSIPARRGVWQARAEARWEQTQAALAQWQQRQEQTRGQQSGLEALGPTSGKASTPDAEDGAAVVLGLGRVDATHAGLPALSQ